MRVEVDLRATVAASAPKLFGLGGNIWQIPAIFDAGIGDRILEKRSLGTTRVSLGDTIFEHADSLQDLERRLDEFPLNEFLRRYTAGGGRVLFILDGVPRWLSSNQRPEKVKGPDQPIFRMSPPADYGEWSKAVEAVVRHFNGKLGLNAYYEAWNEPNYYYHGSFEQFMRQYYHSVLGARRADSRALVGGPGISEFLGTTTALPPGESDAEKVRIATQSLEHRFFFRQFLEQAARTPLPELGLARLPVDFFSWHAFYFDPARYYAVVAPHIREALAQSGYPRATPLINSEWNIAPVPPYPEGDLNATEVDAAYVAASLIAMNEAGVDAQSFQMYVDPGGEGYFGGMFTVTGIPRANFHAFSLLSRMRGRQVSVRTTDPWVKATAFVDGETVSVIVASYVPTPKMLANTQSLADFLENRDFTRSIVSANLVEGMVKGRAMPESHAKRAREIEETTRRRVLADVGKAARLPGRVPLELALSGAAPRRVTRYVIDSKHANIFPDLAKANRLLESRTRGQGSDEAQFLRSLEDSGLSREASQEFLAELRRGAPGDRALAKVPAERREAAVRALHDARRQLVARYREALAEVENLPSARLAGESMAWPASGPLKIEAERNSVQLFVITP